MYANPERVLVIMITGKGTLNIMDKTNFHFLDVALNDNEEFNATYQWLNIM